MISRWSHSTGVSIVAHATMEKPPSLPIVSAQDVMSVSPGWRWGMSRENQRHIKTPFIIHRYLSGRAKWKSVLTTKSMHRPRNAMIATRGFFRSRKARTTLHLRITTGRNHVLDVTTGKRHFPGTIATVAIKIGLKLPRPVSYTHLRAH